MRTDDTARSLSHLFSELVDGVMGSQGGFVLNTGDIGMLKSLDKLSAGREIDGFGFTGPVSSIGHLAYHLGAIRQIDKSARGPKEGTF